jgi:hypothetical protein
MCHLFSRDVGLDPDILKVAGLYYKGNAREANGVRAWRRPITLTITAVARAVVANAPTAEAAGAPSGDRPEVAAVCGLDAANAVADRFRSATAYDAVGDSLQSMS